MCLSPFSFQSTPGGWYKQTWGVFPAIVVSPQVSVIPGATLQPLRGLHQAFVFNTEPQAVFSKGLSPKLRNHGAMGKVIVQQQGLNFRIHAKV